SNALRRTQPSDQESAWQQVPFQSVSPPPSMEYCEVLFFLLTHFFHLFQSCFKKFKKLFKSALITLHVTDEQDGKSLAYNFKCIIYRT
ncbi:MAG: hypothetical protein WCF01_09470, partial [Nitrososphaeraceae archaeon]